MKNSFILEVHVEKHFPRMYVTSMCCASHTCTCTGVCCALAQSHPHLNSATVWKVPTPFHWCGGLLWCNFISPCRDLCHLVCITVSANLNDLQLLELWNKLSANIFPMGLPQNCENLTHTNLCPCTVCMNGNTVDLEIFESIDFIRRAHRWKLTNTMTFLVFDVKNFSASNFRWCKVPPNVFWRQIFSDQQ